jgi:hypothetical protein
MVAELTFSPLIFLIEADGITCFTLSCACDSKILQSERNMNEIDKNMVLINAPKENGE